MRWFDDAEEEAVLHGGFSFTERCCALRVVTLITITGPRAWPEEFAAEDADRVLRWQDEPPR